MLEGKYLEHYHLMRRIGSGGMGEIYLAEDTRIQRQVAVKVLRAEANPYPDAEAVKDTQKLFQREMRAITMLDHPHILPLYDFGEARIDNGTLAYMVTPWRPEGSFSDWLQRRGPAARLNIGEIVYFIYQAADALQHVHEHGLIHQDVKPSNFLVRERPGNPLPDLLLSDFGISKITTSNSTTSMSIRGTPAFMAPEQWDGRPVFATDQYALAIMAYLLLTGHAPFTGRMEQVMRQHFSAPPLAPSALNPAVAPDLDRVILVALSKQPESRFASVSAFSRAFRQAAQVPGGPGVAPEIPLSAGDLVRQTPGPGPASVPSPVHLVEPLPGNQPQAVPQQYPVNNTPGWPPQIAPPPPIYPVAASSFPVSVGQGSAERGNSLPGVDMTPPQFGLAPGGPAAPRKKPAALIVLICVLILLVVSGGIGFGVYQNHVTTANATSTAQTAAVAQSTAQVQATTNASNARATATVGVRATSTAQVLAANPYPSYMTGSGTFLFRDPLQVAEHWNSGDNADFGGNCQFMQNALYVSQTKAQRFFSCVGRDTLSSFALEIKMTIVQGDCGSIFFLSNPSAGKGYIFEICSNGNYGLWRYKDLTGSDAFELASGKTTLSNEGPGVSNTLGIVVHNGTMTLYVNRQQLDSASDTTYSSGVIALCADMREDTTEVAFTNARVWRVKS